ncbi:MAG TPA: carboxypeptidase-like regulatory domain-containing protein, partial [Verrucomicrobiae bacterium]|nr:carboxypeptidase-like regulatory domain-containing protein [Verrucomicrobiae bacterium]
MLKKHHPTIAITVAALAIFFAQIVTAQERAGSLQGVIKDTKGAPVVGAYVKMKNAERRVTYMVVSQAQG